MLNNKSKEWLAGLIDGDGCFLLSQKSYGSLEITMDIRDTLCLYKIKNIYGGSIKLRSNSKSMRYRLHHKQGLINLLNDVNGLIRHSTRLIQYHKLCIKYNIIMKNTSLLIYNNNWMGGFFDADGTICINKITKRLYISISQKTQELLIPLKVLYKGEIYIDRNSNTFKWYLNKQEDVLNLLNNYIKLNYLFSKKKNRFYLIEKFYELKVLEKQQNIFINKLWEEFFNKWDKYEE